MLEREIFGIALKWLLLAVAAVALVVWASAHWIGNSARGVRQARADAGASDAMQEAGAQAVETVLEQSDREVQLHELVNDAAKEIDDAPDQDAARAATLRAACQLQLYRNDPACALR